MKEIDKKIKAYYESKSLSKDQIDRIVNSQKQGQKKSWKPFLKYAAIFFLFLIPFVLYQYRSVKEKNILEKYAKEVAFNHHKNLESDILTQNVADLNTKMHKLNFEIHIPQDIENKYQLLGGRYCSIDERLAAQLKLKNKQTDQVETLYVLDKIQSDDYKKSFFIDSTSIRIWNEQSNLFVLASEASK